MLGTTHRPLLFSLLFLALAQTAAAQGPPCRPCAGVRVADPAAAAGALADEPRLADEARLYVAWPAELDGSADAAGFETVSAAGGTPWMIARFRTPPPLNQNLARLEAELRELARLAGAAGERAHVEIDWRPDAEPEVKDHAFLLKRAAVTVTGARGDARVLAGPLAPDASYLRALYAEEVAAYLDGVALAPGEGREEATAALAELDPGKPVVVDARPWPEEPARTLALAAADAAAGIAVTLFEVPAPTAVDLAPLKVLAREFQGDLSYDPYTVPSGAREAWTFVRGEDLSLRVVAEAEPGAAQLQLYFEDPLLKKPQRFDPATGAAEPVFGQSRTQSGLVVPVSEPGAVTLLSLERMTAAELEGIAEEVEVATERGMPVEEILRRLQAFEDAQARKVERYQASSILHLRFLLADGSASVEASFEGPFFYERGQGFDWVWETLYIDGVRWRGKKLPEIPLIQPEKAAALPVEITFGKEYAYRLRGTATVDGRDAWVIDFEPLEVEPGRSLYQGTVWVDREIYARLKTRALQLGLEGDVISNEETMVFTPLDAQGQPAPYVPESYFLPTRVVGQQVLSVLNATVPVERETVMRDVRINPAGFEEARAEARASEKTMVRDTDKGLRYLVKDETGERVVQEEFDTTRLFLAGGVFFDESVDFPIPLAGINYLALDWRDTGNQVNVFFAGPLLTATISRPRLMDTRWNAGATLFGFFIKRGDELFRDGREVPAEEVESRTESLSLSLGRPLGSFVNLDLGYRARHDTFGRADDTAEEFVLPTDTFTHTVRGELSYNRSGYALNLSGSFHDRSDWDFWGLPGNDEFSPEQKDYTRWQASVAKTWWLPKFTKLGVELEHLDGSDLDRFSRYDFGLFGDGSVAGYPNGLVRGDSATGAHLSYGINLADVLRVELEGDAVWATNEDTGLRDELLAGLGLEGTIAIPWQSLLVNFEVGYALEGPGDGDVAARIVFLRLFGAK